MGKRGKPASRDYPRGPRHRKTHFLETTFKKVHFLVEQLEVSGWIPLDVFAVLVFKGRGVGFTWLKPRTTLDRNCSSFHRETVNISLCRQFYLSTQHCLLGEKK